MAKLIDKYNIFFSRSNYQTFSKHYTEAQNELKTMMSKGYYKKSIITDKAQKLANSLNNEYHQVISDNAVYANNLINEAKNDAKPKYEDPQAEIIRRQDFDNNLKLASDSDLDNIINNLDQQKHINVSDFIAVKNRVAKVQNAPTRQAQLDKLTHIKVLHNVGNEYMNTDKFKQGNALNYANNQFKSTPWLFNEGFNDVAPTDINQSLTALTDNYQE